VNIELPYVVDHSVVEEAALQDREYDMWCCGFQNECSVMIGLSKHVYLVQVYLCGIQHCQFAWVLVLWHVRLTQERNNKRQPIASTTNRECSRLERKAAPTGTNLVSLLAFVLSHSMGSNWRFVTKKLQPAVHSLSDRLEARKTNLAARLAKSG
jgi:hypothetical protein